MLTRRQFLGQSALALAGTTLVPPFLARAAHAAQEGSAVSRYGDETVLVVIQMSGGNDGLNTVVPYGLDGYRDARPTLAMNEHEVLPLTDRLGLHPEMSGLHELYRAGRVAIVQGVGYPNPNLSHFRSLDIWHTAAPDTFESTGWLASSLAATDLAHENPIYAASVTDGLIRALHGNGASVPTIASLPAYQLRTDGRYPNDRPGRLGYANWVCGLDYGTKALEGQIARTAATALASSERVQQAAAAYTSLVEYPAFPLANSLKTVATLMAGELGTRIYYVAFGGFDTHSAQPSAQARLLGGFSNSVAAFFADLGDLGKAENVMLMTFSEFGRRVNENGSQGTDHGTAGPMFLIGPRVRGGLYGEHPSLTDLDSNKNLQFGIDFRAVYGTALEGWLGADQETVLGASYESVGFV